MNTKQLKYLGIFATAAIVASLVGYLFWTTKPHRRIANENAETENLTENQKQKWATVQQFQIRQTNEAILIDIPHLVDLCTDNIVLAFQFSAFEVSISGNHPALNLKISCSLALEKMQTQFQINYADLLSLHQLKQIKIPTGELQSDLIYSDEAFPLRWNLSKISLEGRNAFEINQFEIQKVFGNNFEFELIAK